MEKKLKQLEKNETFGGKVGECWSWKTFGKQVGKAGKV